MAVHSPQAAGRTVTDLRLPPVKLHGQVVSGHPMGTLWDAGTVRAGTFRCVPKKVGFSLVGDQ